MGLMATTPRSRTIEYPTSDGKPMAETEVHRDNMLDLIETLKAHFAADPMAYVSGNMLMFYEEGNNREHLAPDVFVARGVPKRLRDNYLIWEEGKGPDLVIELTSKTTRREDQTKKLALYRDVLRVPEYFQLDPTEDYLKPPMQGHRLRRGATFPSNRLSAAFRPSAWDCTWSGTATGCDSTIPSPVVACPRPPNGPRRPRPRTNAFAARSRS